jgi:(R,R)-butanediol dehydrogenase/meso-butanediol dehydrogenase/diacetyl reductase
MKALRIYGKRDLRYEEVPEPAPSTGQVKIRISFAGICGSDLSEYVHLNVIPADRLPITIGHEFSGRVVEVGEGVSEFKVGDRVTGVGYRYCGKCFYCQRGIFNLCEKAGFSGLTDDGCMAEYLIAPIYSTYKLPDSVSDEYGALVEPLSVSFHAVRQGKVQLGDRVAIVGDGTIGLGVLLATRAAGASKAYVIAKHKRRGDSALAMGATQVIYKDDGDPVQSIRNLTDGLGADIVIESAGSQDSPKLAVDLTRAGGTTVVVGLSEKPNLFDFKQVVFLEKNIIGNAIYINEAKTVIDMLVDGRIDPGHLITSIVALKDAVGLGFEKLLVDKEANIKILLKP